MNQSFYMHSRYDEFKEFLNTVNSEARINPNALNLAFDVWLSQNNHSIIKKQSAELSKLIDDLNRLHRERDSFQRQASVLAEEVDRLQGDLKRARDALASALIVLGGQAFGERGHACMSIDGGNL